MKKAVCIGHILSICVSKFNTNAIVSLKFKVLRKLFGL